MYGTRSPESGGQPRQTAGAGEGGSQGGRLWAACALGWFGCFVGLGLLGGFDGFPKNKAPW